MSFVLSTHEKWDEVTQLLEKHKLSGGNVNGSASLPELYDIAKQSINASDEQIKLFDKALVLLHSELHKNADYLSQKSMPRQLGLPFFKPQAIAQASTLNPESLIFAISSLTESLQKANSQMEQIARFGYFTTFQAVFKDEKLVGAALSAVDFKSRSFEIGYVPVLTQSEVTLTSFDKQSVSVGEHKLNAIILDNSGAVSYLKGPLGETALAMLKEPFVLFFDGHVHRGAAASTELINKISSAMYASYSEIKSPPEIASHLTKKHLVAIPLGTPHRAVIAQLNKLERSFSQTLSSAVMRGLSTAQIHDKLQLMGGKLNEYKTTPDTKNVVTDLIGIIAKELVPEDDISGRQYLEKYIFDLLSHPAAPSTEKEREIWKNLIDRKIPQIEQMRFVMLSIFKSGSGLYMNRPKSDFKFNEVSLKTNYVPNKERAKQIYFEPTPKENTSKTNDVSKPTDDSAKKLSPTQPVDKEHKKYKSDRVRLPGKRDEHVHAVRAVLLDPELSAEQSVKEIVNALQPGLYAYFAMHRQESMSHLVRSIKTSRDDVFVKQAINIMVSSVEAQFSEIGGVIAPSPLPTTETNSSLARSENQREQIEQQWTKPRRGT